MSTNEFSIVKTLMRRDGFSREEAENQVLAAYEDLQSRLDEGEDTFYICEEWFGLEPDYNFDLIDEGYALAKKKGGKNVEI